MFPFWEPVIEPLVRAANANRIVEIGALRGETTALMLGDLGPTAELHVIDPLPQFDPAEHEARFNGRYVFHKDLSLNILPTANAFDFALIDGDHNWYTVYHELQHLRDAARRDNTHLPLMVLHDVAWPYGRRDLYYAPEQIPEEFRQPHDQRGMRPGTKHLLPGGGMNTTLDNALNEGGERNGVRTALDDFIAEHDKPIRQVIFPIYYGLAIVAEHDYLDEHPAVAELLDYWESLQGQQQLVTLSESIRLDETVFTHNVDRNRNDKLTRNQDNYLRLLRKSLTAGAPRDLDALHEALETARSSGLSGDFLDIGPDAGASAVYMRGYADAFDAVGRGVVVVGDTDRSIEGRFAEFDLLDERTTLLHGTSAEALADTSDRAFSFVRVGTSDGASSLLSSLADRLESTAVVFVDGAGSDETAEIERTCAERSLQLVVAPGG